MPYRRKRSYRKRASPMWKKYSGFYSRMPVGLNQTFVTPTKIVRMRWTSSFTTLVGTAGAMNSSYYAANDIYNVDGSNHQPFGWDTLRTIYQDWVVLGSKIRLKICQRNTVQAQPTWFVVSWNPQAYATPPTPNYSSIAAYRDAQRGGQVLCPGDYGNDVWTVSATYSPRKAYGNDLFTGDYFYGTSTPASPLSPSTFEVDYGSASGQTLNAGAFEVEVCIDYVVMWGYTKALAIS